MPVNILGGLTAIRHPVAKPTWLASRLRELAPTAPQVEDPARRRRLKPTAGFSPRHRHAHEGAPGSASRPHQLRPALLAKCQLHRPQRRCRSGATAPCMSGKLAAESLPGMRAERKEAQREQCPVTRPCMASKCAWAGCLALAARLALERPVASLCRSPCVRPLLRCIITKAE